ncbi:NAD(P)/FAD-dependent oxidoreductase [Leifsonia sp. NPDC058230]|uniref:NAD(P)/FAD-dependent oxidoreductase n=1 Tax=Leifsonia sp. NPDC058230 TaxID=3346391 RepID=UPI0036DC7CEF
MRIVVVGAGSIGANVAYRLREHGADVVLVEAGAPAGGTSSSSFAWLSSFPQMSWSEEPGRAALRRTVHPRFHELSSELGGDWIHWVGTLTWGAPEERVALRESALTCRERGVDLDLLDAAVVGGRFPGLRVDDDDEFVFESDSGWVDAPALIDRLLARFQAQGGSLRRNSSVVELVRSGDAVRGVVTGQGETIEADVVVNATGSWGSHLAALAGVAIPLDLVPGLMIYTDPIDPAAVPGCVLDAPTWLSRPDPSGGLAIHWRGEGMSKVHGANGWSAERILADIATTLPALEQVGVARTSVGVRPIPPGGPVVGELPWTPGLYHVLSHGGIGWGPVWADLAVRELLQGEDVPELAAARPERFYLQTPAIGRFADDAEQTPLVTA